MKETMWKKHFALLASTALMLQLMAFGSVSSLAVTDGDMLTDETVQTETLTPEEEFSETGSTPVICYSTKVEYDTSPMKVGETRPIYFHHPMTMKSGDAMFLEVSSNLSYTYEPGVNAVFVTALAEGDAKMYVMAEGCAFGAYVNLTVEAGTLPPTESYEETTTTTTEEIHADYLTKVEYDNSPMQVGETRAIRFYHPETLKGGKGSIYEVSDNLSYTYEEGSDTIYVTALAEGDAKMYVMAEGCAFGSYVRLTVKAAEAVPGDLDGDNIVNTTDAALLLTAAAQSGAGAQRSITQTAADLNGDGTGDAADAALILQYAAYAGTGGTLSVMDFLKDLLT